MRFFYRSNTVRVLLVIFALYSIVFTQASCSSILRAIRSQRPAIAEKPADEQWAGLVAIDDASQLAVDMRDALRNGNYRAIEAEMKKARESKDRFPGGGWKIKVIYEGLEDPKEANLATDKDWASHLDSLKKWKQQYPDSITASTALAQAHIGYAWQARGSGYSNSVSKENWKLFDERIDQADQLLTAAKDLPEKCPEWHRQRLIVALAKDAGYDEYNDLFEEAVKLEPLYFYNYREKARYLLPQWSGKPGESMKFAAKTADKIGGQEGSAMYYFIASEILKYSQSGRFEKTSDIWQRLKKGYEDQQALYGESNYRDNEFASFAMHAFDLDSACPVMTKIGDRMAESIWKKDAFDGFKKFCEMKIQSDAKNAQIAKEKMPPENEQHP